MEVMQAIKERRSIRKYKSAPVSDNNLMIVMEAGQSAPSWANTQCWQFIVVRDAEKKRSIQKILSLGNQSKLNLDIVPIVIAACVEHEKSGYRDGKVVTDKGNSWSMLDLGLALQNITLAAYSLGLGTLHVGMFDNSEVARILGVPENITVVELMLLGYPDEQPAARSRKALSKIVHYDQYIPQQEE